MSIYSEPLVTKAALTGSSSATVPAGYVWIVRDIDVVLKTAADAYFVVTGALGQQFWWIHHAAADTTLWYGWRGRQVLLAGEGLGVEAISEAWDVSISGYQLTSS